MNSVVLMGRLTADPTINDRITCASFQLAVDRKFKKDGEPTADFISCKLLGEKRAEFANKYLRKGIKIVVCGSIQTGSYEKKDGTKVYTTDVIVDTTEFAESKNANQSERPQVAPQTDSNGFMNIPDGIDEELPFN